MLFSKDLEWLVTVERSLPGSIAQHYILWEIAFVMTVTFCYLALIIHGYGRNLGLSCASRPHHGQSTVVVTSTPGCGHPEVTNSA